MFLLSPSSLPSKLTSWIFSYASLPWQKWASSSRAPPQRVRACVLGQQSGWGRVGVLNVDARARSGHRTRSLSCRGRAAARGAGRGAWRAEPNTFSLHPRVDHGKGLAFFNARTRAPPLRFASDHSHAVVRAAAAGRGAWLAASQSNLILSAQLLQSRLAFLTPAHAHPPFSSHDRLFHAVGEPPRGVRWRVDPSQPLNTSPIPQKHSPACRACSWRTPARRARAPAQRT